MATRDRSSDNSGITRIAASALATLGIGVVMVGVPGVWIARVTGTTVGQLTTGLSFLEIISLAAVPVWISLGAAILMAGRPLRHSVLVPTTWQQFFRQWVQISWFGAGALVQKWTVIAPDTDLSTIVRPTIDPVRVTDPVDASVTATNGPSSSPPLPEAAVESPLPEPLGEMTEYAVRRGDNLRSLAEQFLGDGDRWQDLLLANVGYEVAPGVTLTEDTRLLKQGWNVRVPVTTESVSG